MNLLGALMIAVFGFLFVTVSSRLTGEIGSSSNPISGMTVATLLLTCLIFLLLGWTGPSYYVTALSVGAIVCIAASNGGTTSQDLKTGYLVGATPRLQQIAILIGALASALVLGPILLKLNEAATVYVPVAQVTRKPADRTGRRARAPRRLARVRRRADDGGRIASGTSATPQVRPAGKYLVDARQPTRRVAGGSRHQWHLRHAPGRQQGAQVRRAQGHADELHHQGHPRPASCPGASCCSA